MQQGVTYVTGIRCNLCADMVKGSERSQAGLTRDRKAVNPLTRRVRKSGSQPAPNEAVST